MEESRGGPATISIYLSIYLFICSYGTQFHIYLPWINAHIAYFLNSVLNVKALSTRRRLSVIVKLKLCEGLFPALVFTGLVTEF